MRILPALAVLALSLTMTADPGLPGKWVGTVDSNGTPVELYYTFAVDGEKLSGEFQGPQGTVPIDKGTYKDSVLSFDIITLRGALHMDGRYYGDSVTIDLKPRDKPVHLVLKRSK